MAKNEKADRSQMNIRLDEELKCLLSDLAPLAKEATGLNVTQTDLVRLGLKALAREYKSKETKGRKQ